MPIPFNPIPPAERPDGSRFCDPVWQRWLTSISSALKSLTKQVSSSPLTVADYAGLRAITSDNSSAYVTGYLASSAPSGISGLFIRDDTDSTSSDNGGTVIVDGLGRRWKRAYAKNDLNVLWFGITQTATSSANASIMQSLLDSMTTGGTVLFPSGNWPMGSVTVTNDRTNIRGEGNATLILNANDDGLIVGLSGVELSFCEVRNLKFDRASPSAAGAAVKMVNTAYSAVRNCEFRNSNAGIWVKTHNDSLQIEDCHFYDGTYYGIYQYNQNETWANDLRITRNYFWHVQYAALYMSGDGVGVSSVGDTYFHNNLVCSSVSKGALQTQYGVRVDGVGSYNTNIRVEHNVFEGLAKQFVWMVGLNRSPVIGNYFSGTDTNITGLYFGGGVGNSQIADNTFIGFNGAGAFFYGCGGLVLQGNIFGSNATTGGSVAELTLQNVTNIILDGNYFYSSSSKWCIDVTQSGATVDFLTYTNNQFIKAGGNANYQYDIRHNNFGGNRILKGNLGNDATSGRDTAPPVAAMGLQWYAGERIENTTASELGTAGGKYTIDGWVCVAQGAPGTWLQRRILTGN